MREVLMPRTIVVGLSALFITASAVAHAQPQPTAGSPPAPATAEAQAPERLSDADFKAFTDRRIELLKFALQLTPDQAKNWPAVEEAIRARAMARHQRADTQCHNGALPKILLFLAANRWSTFPSRFEHVE